MTADELRARLEASLQPLRCAFAPRAPAKELRFRLLDGMGRTTPEYAVPVATVPDDDAFEAVLGQVLRRVERDGFRHA